MRIWDIPPENLCHKHLLGEHRELHGLWNILTQNKKGYSQHPETKRWVGKLKALYLRHQQLANEIEKRGWNHKSPLDEKLAIGKHSQELFLNTIEEQQIILQRKNCDCYA